MSKVIGAILTIIGGFLSLYTYFIYMNSSAFIDYNAEETVRMSDVGLVLPMLAGLFMLVTGIIFLKNSDHR